MIHSKNRSGFSLLETIAAMTIVAFVVSPLVIMQGTALRRVMRDSAHMERIFLMRNFLLEARREAASGATHLKKQYHTKHTIALSTDATSIKLFTTCNERHSDRTHYRNMA